MKKNIRVWFVLASLFSTVANADPTGPERKPSPSTETEKVSGDQITEWQDPQTGYRYLYLPEKRTYTRARWACQNRGWQLFNLKYLAPDERTRFLTSPLIAGLAWSVRFAGEPAERKEAGVWLSTLYSSTVSGTVEGLYFTLRKTIGRQETLIRRLEEGTPDEGPQLSTVCMLRSETWYRCSAEQICERFAVQPQPGAPTYLYPLPPIHTYIEEEGFTREAAWEQILKSGSSSTRDAWGGGNICSVYAPSFSCAELP